jgi:hypothetical protein
MRFARPGHTLENWLCGTVGTSLPSRRVSRRCRLFSAFPWSRHLGRRVETVRRGSAMAGRRPVHGPRTFLHPHRHTPGITAPPPNSASNPRKVRDRADRRRGSRSACLQLPAWAGLERLSNLSLDAAAVTHGVAVVVAHSRTPAPRDPASDVEAWSWWPSGWCGQRPSREGSARPCQGRVDVGLEQLIERLDGTTGWRGACLAAPPRGATTRCRRRETTVSPTSSTEYLLSAFRGGLEIPITSPFPIK